jgi:hypothetical protein
MNMTVSEDILPATPPPPRTAFDRIENRYGDRPVLLVILFMLASGGTGFLIGAVGYGSGTLFQGEVLGTATAIAGGLSGVFRIRRHGKPQPPRLHQAPTGWRWFVHLLVDCKNPTPRPAAAGTMRAAWATNVPGSLRLLLYGLLTVACGVAAAKLVADWLGICLVVAGGWMLSAAKFRRD